MNAVPDDGVDDELREAADLFLERLLDAPLERRSTMVNALRADDPPLAALVESLLVHLDDVDGFLEEPLRVAPDDDRADDGSAFIGARFGHWQVRRTIGHGGMGLVFEVDRADGVVEQRAALKLIRRGFDDRSILARFSAERQILAALDHPSIARLIDAGAGNGRPYLVMEYIDGVPIDRWCAERDLSIEDRIALFNQVCAAVHYAHQRLVVHRDLKPGNILVTADGLPKLLDFGISKLIGADGASAASAETIDAAALLTPRYASPEQLTGAPISTASDVYSLGVLLYELLTGSTPYRTRNDSLVEMMRAVMTEQPARPSTVVAGADAMTRASARVVGDAGRGPDAGDATRRARRLRGDIDHILLKALAKEPSDRYESVAALRDDLVRHLNGNPIRAVPPRWPYRAGKFVRRHRAAVALAAVVVVAIVGLGLVATREAYRADRARDVAEAERARAESRFEDTRSLARAMLFDVNDAIATGPTKAREQLVRTALTYLDRLAQDRSSTGLQRDVADGYEKISEILGNQANDNLGRSAEAQVYLEKALAIRERLAAAAPDDLDNLKGLINVNDSLGHMARFAANPQQAARYFAAATAAAKRQLALSPDDPKAQLTLFGRRRAEALIAYSPGRPSLRRFDDARRAFEALIADADAYGAAHPGVARLDYLKEVFVNELATLQWMNGDATEALQNARRDLELCEAAVRAHPDDPGSNRDLAIATRLVGESLLQLGREDEGMPMLRRSMAIRQKLAAADPSNARADRDLAIGHSMLGNAADLAGRPREALVEYKAWARHAEAALQREPSNIGHRLDLAQARWSIADMHRALGDSALALTEARRVEADVRAFDATTRAQEAAREALGMARLVAAKALAARAPSSPDAFAIAREGVEELDRLHAQTPEDGFVARDAARARVDAGTIGIDGRGEDRAAGCALIASGRALYAELEAQRRLSAQARRFVDEAARAAARCEPAARIAQR